MDEKGTFRRFMQRLKEYFNCIYIPLEEDIFEENCVVFKGLRENDPFGDILHIGYVLFKVLRINFEVKRIVLLEEKDGENKMVIEFTENIMAVHMLQKAEMVLPSIKAERYVVCNNSPIF
ncbi:hypothetical protein ACFFRR_000255 [Megaselia abdita]